MSPTKIHEHHAAFFQALSHRRRQMLFTILLQHRGKGLSFGELQRLSKLSGATLSHHLRFMEQGGILRRKQKGPQTWLSLDIAYIRNITIGFGNHAIAA